MPALDQNAASMALGALTGYSAWVNTVTGLKLRLMVNAPTAAVPGTELSATGYTAGGLAVTWSAPTLTPYGAQIANSNLLSWTNSGTGPWSLAGWELWDQGGTPARKLYGLWDDSPVSVSAGSPLQVAIGALVLQFP